MTSKTETRNDKLRAAHDKLQHAVAEIVSGDEWKCMLKVASKFHRYSFNNHLMIFLQRPEATVVAGFNRWKSLGRLVMKGEKGIAIFAPCRHKTKVETDGGEERTVQQIRGFRLVQVFDISQTEGEDLRGSSWPASSSSAAGRTTTATSVRVSRSRSATWDRTFSSLPQR